ncbi:phosphate-starvation-inducible PsiE family protein [Gallaecimonas kandeliae]|uniref:phosphate-starvation-inducible protein PsiE n=1 Tax=Gallaecimonas kandeliae TaxID=3029055 RepID=UPI00264923D2|nr:phosphate-starvation-inducible PsiE family protein [Gallaecimonas kandeliae]WKE64586.1 phosphate-starvation-inducible PsiE family protein [Gallaecimonas kandeliae]
MNRFQRWSRDGLAVVQDLVLAIVAVATLILIVSEVWLMISARAVTLADLLLLFIYLEVLAMVSLYLESGKLPIRMPLYIAIVALARYITLDMKEMDSLRVLAAATAALVLAFTVLVIRYGHLKLPYPYKD